MAVCGRLEYRNKSSQAQELFRFIEYLKLRTRKSGHIRYIDMHLVVPKQMTVEARHALTHQITADIEKCLAHSHILVHIEPCPSDCVKCTVECPKLSINQERRTT